MLSSYRGRSEPEAAAVFLLTAAFLVSVWLVPRADAAFPGKNGRILVQGLRGTGLIRPDGGGYRAIRLKKGFGDFPSLSADGRMVAFTGGRANAIYTARIDGRKLKRLTTRAGFWPTWSPGGRWIAFTGDRVRGGRGYSGIKLVRTDGRRERFLVKDPMSDYPAWSPDGRRIAFSRDGDVYVVNRDGSGLRLVVPGSPAGYPDWSPDGKKILFVSDLGGPLGFPSDQWWSTVSADGSGQRRVFNQACTPLPGFDFCSHRWCKWSPDGRKIVCTAGHASTGGRYQDEVVIMRADGSARKSIVRGLGALGWSPHQSARKR
jgi:TolB protein